MKNPFKSKPAPTPAAPAAPSQSGTCSCCGDNLTRGGRCPMCTGLLDGALCECQRP